MNRKIILLLLSLAWITSCSYTPETPIYKIYELCRKDKTDPAVVAKFKELGLEDVAKGGGYYDRFYEPHSRTDYDYVSVTINPQPTYNNIQGFFITWNKDLGSLTFEEIQQMVGVSLPRRGAKAIRVTESAGNTWFYVLGHENPKHPDLVQVTVTCAKNNYDKCWQIQLDCFGFVHPD